VLRREVLALLAAIEDEEAHQRASIDAALPKHRQSATNLALHRPAKARHPSPATSLLTTLPLDVFSSKSLLAQAALTARGPTTSPILDGP